MNTGYLFLCNLSTLAAALLVLWGLSLWLRNSSIIDIFWGLGFVIVAGLSLVMGENWSVKSLLLTLMVSIWGIRLAGYLAWRNLGKPEDYRYAAMRVRHGQRFPLFSLFSVFGLQGLLTAIISLPLQVGISQPSDWNSLSYLGVIVWSVGLAFESVGDYQLARFKSDPSNAGQVMNRGLWRYTRHPNYFGDFLVWWGLFLAAVEPGSWWWTISGPLLMSFLLIRVSGVRLLESSLRSRIVGYEQYVRSTSAFLPLPPK
jgi:steroid 5-alpha reductase family enzyme